MDDYIKRIEAYNAIVTDMQSRGERTNFREENVRKVIDSIPAAEVRENVRGKWEDYDDTERFSARCSICGGIAETRFGMNFCGYCGAEMREAKPNE